MKRKQAVVRPKPTELLKQLHEAKRRIEALEYQIAHDYELRPEKPHYGTYSHEPATWRERCEQAQRAQHAESMERLLRDRILTNLATVLDGATRAVLEAVVPVVGQTHA